MINGWFYFVMIITFIIITKIIITFIIITPTSGNGILSKSGVFDPHLDKKVKVFVQISLFLVDLDKKRKDAVFI